MIDFLMVSTRHAKDATEIYPRFIIKKSSDLMIRGGDFYAVWLENRGLWSTDEQDALQLIDDELDKYAKENRQRFDSVRILHMWDAASGMIDVWHKYCQRQMRDSFHMLDDRLTFSNTKTTKEDYASKRLTYPLEAGDLSAYNKLVSTLYSEEERQKIEWAIGSIVAGESQKLQKFIVLYGAPKTGKSTLLNIIQELFEGYYTTFDAKALTSASNAFALEAFKTNPLVAIQHDGDLSHIEDNTRLNSLVSHEMMTVNEKFKSTYSNRFRCFLFMGTNKPVKIADAKSGLIRRLIDVSPSGNRLSQNEYDVVKKEIKFELGAIAHHCQEVYLRDPGAYDNYIPFNMLDASNDFYNFVTDSYFIFKKDDGTTLKAAWEMYKTYCDEAKVPFPFSQRVFKEELRNYFRDFQDRFNLEDGSRVRSYYSGFRTEKFNNDISDNSEEHQSSWIAFDSTKSIFDDECQDCFAQYATSEGIPSMRWDTVETKLKDLDTSKTHYIRPPTQHVVVDFDIPDESGNKSLEKNIEAASKWPPTYAELSNSGQAIHLHYIYTGDVSKLNPKFDEYIEIKVFTGKSALRRRLSKCNDLSIKTISSGLPLKGERKMVNLESIKSEKGLRNFIKRNLNKEIHPYTKPSIDFIYKKLEEAYINGLKYDVTDMRNAVLAFAANSTHQSEACIKLVDKMHFKSDDASLAIKNDDSSLVFFDIEVFPNVFFVNFKIRGKSKPMVRFINPTPTQIEELIRFRLIGFCCRRYDNHILYARMLGYDNKQLFNLSQKIVNGNPGCFFGEAYNISYTDIYDFASSQNKKSLKKLEIEMGIHHQELGLPWDKPVPEELWPKVSEYCDNDVIATEAAFDYLSADWTARQILADLAGMSVNDTTNTLTERIIFGKNKNPQNQFHYRNLAEPVYHMDQATMDFLKEACPEMMAQKHGEAQSLLPYFPGYTYENGKSIYREVEIGEGGKVVATPGIHVNVALLDIISQHPHSAIAEVLFGVKFTRKFRELVEGRVSIKHEAWDEVNVMLNGKLTPYIQKVIDGEMTAKDLANALKTAINSVYGLTSANFDTLFRDKRNKDNIVAKRGALFMTDLQHEVEERGFVVAHIKTDSIKIPNATSEIIQFVMDFGKKYGYTFEHEATYERMCLVNDAVYIAKFADVKTCKKLYNYIPSDNQKYEGQWTATGKQFQVPYVFKTLFSKEPIEFEDLCEIRSVTSALYLDMNEALPDVTDAENIQIIRRKSEDQRTRSDYARLLDWERTTDEELAKIIAKGHDYHFIGKVGEFCPVKPGCGGGLLMREKDGKYYSVGSSKGYRWLESEMIRKLKKEDAIDTSYYDTLVDKTIESISEYGDFEWFVSGDLYTNDSSYTPPWLMPCGDAKYSTCFECPRYSSTGDRCKQGYDISNVIKTA